MTARTITDEVQTRILIPGTYNLRAVGPMPASSPLLADHRLFRSDALHALDDQGLQHLDSLGISRILDLRSHEEAATRPDRIPPGTEYIHIPMTLVDGQRDHGISLDLTPLYARMVRDHGASLTRAVEQLISIGNGAVLVHCTAGKDRTGLVVALALLAVGVGEADVVIDYARTESHLVGEWTEGMLDELRRHGFPVNEQTIKLLNGSPAETMVDTISLLNEEFGGAANYLTMHGMTSHQLQSLEASLLHPTQPENSRKEPTHD